MPLILGANDLQRFYTFVDVAYATNSDRKSHTGGCITFGRGVVHAKSSKQKLNAKSSTEGEIIGFSDYLTYPIWLTHYLQRQGEKGIGSLFFQDNKSAIRIGENGQMSMGQKSKHIEIRYFFVKDRTSGNNIKVGYCPTEKMISDFLTKPLQGSLFREFRAILMGHVELGKELLNLETCK